MSFIRVDSCDSWLNSFRVAHSYFISASEWLGPGGGLSIEPSLAATPSDPPTGG